MLRDTPSNNGFHYDSATKHLSAGSATTHSRPATTILCAMSYQGSPVCCQTSYNNALNFYVHCALSWEHKAATWDSSRKRTETEDLWRIRFVTKEVREALHSTRSQAAPGAEDAAGTQTARTAPSTGRTSTVNPQSLSPVTPVTLNLFLTSVSPAFKRVCTVIRLRSHSNTRRESMKKIAK